MGLLPGVGFGWALQEAEKRRKKEAVERELDRIAKLEQLRQRTEALIAVGAEGQPHSHTAVCVCVSLIDRVSMP